MNTVLIVAGALSVIIIDVLVFVGMLESVADKTIDLDDQRDLMLTIGLSFCLLLSALLAFAVMFGLA